MNYSSQSRDLCIKIYKDMVTDKKIEKRSVLLVDDEPSNLAQLSSILDSKYRVLAVRSGVDALKLLTGSVLPDIIIMDILMPDMDGFETLKAINRITYPEKVPLIFVTTHENETDEEYGFKLGAVDYLYKPVKPAVLMARIETHLEIKESRDLLKSQNQRLEREVQKQVRKNLLLQEVSLTSLVGLAETRDTDTGNHILRTRYYVEAIALQLLQSPIYSKTLSHRRIQLMAKSAQLHDIGKIGIPDSILLKPGKLTDKEFDVMKTHSVIGGDALASALSGALERIRFEEAERNEEAFEFLETARTIATYHHEKWDGTGYPEGLKGEAIPLEARIMAIADVFDALTTRRTYKEAFSFEKSVNIMQESAGTHFDPDLLEAFFREEDRVKQICSKLADSVEAGS